MMPATVLCGGDIPKFLNQFKKNKSNSHIKEGEAYLPRSSQNLVPDNYLLVYPNGLKTPNKVG